MAAVIAIGCRRPPDHERGFDGLVIGRRGSGSVPSSGEEFDRRHTQDAGEVGDHSHREICVIDAIFEIRHGYRADAEVPGDATHRVTAKQSEVPDSPTIQELEFAAIRRT